EKDRDRRYETANGFAADVQRYLAGEAVLAVPPSTAYRLRKFVRRNRRALATAAVVAMALVVAVVGLAASNVIVARERDQKVQALINESAALAKAREQEGLANERAEEARKQAEEARKQQTIATAQEQLARRRYYAAQMNLAVQAWRAGEMPRVLELLEGQRPAAGEEDLRAFEWFYLWRLCNGGHRVSPRGHGTAAMWVTFSPDGKTLASASWDRTVRLWDPSTGGELKVLHGHNGLVWEVVYSPDGKTLASGGKDTPWMILWDVATGRPRHVIPAGSVIGLRFAEDGKTVVGGQINDKTVDFKEWDVASGAERSTILGAGVPVGLVSTGKTLVTLAHQYAPDSEIRFWDLATGRLRKTLTSPGISGAILSPDGTRVATSSQSGVTLWDLTGAKVGTIPVPDGVSGAIAFSPDGKRLAGGTSNRTVTVWEVTSGRQVARDVHLDPVHSVAFSPDGKTLAVGTLGGAIRLWDMIPAEEAVTIPVAAAYCGQFAPDGKTLLVGNKGRTKVIDVAAGKEVADLPTSNVVAISADASVLAERSGRDDYTLWDARAGRKVATVSVPQRTDMSPVVTLSRDGRMLAGHYAWRGDNTVTLWDSATRETRVLKVPDPTANRLSIHCVDFSPDGKLLAAGFQFEWVIIWDIATGKAKVQFSQRPSMMNVTAVAFSPDGKSLAVGADVGAVTLWDVETGKRLVSFRGHTSRVSTLAFSPDGRTLATAGADKTVRLWDVVTGQERATLTGHTGSIGRVLFSPDGYTLATGSSDGTVRLWRGATSPEALARLRPAVRSQNVEDAAASNQRGMDLYHQGKLEESLAHFQQAIDLDPTSAWPHLNVGLVRRREGKIDEAIAAFRKAVEVDPNYVYAYAALGNALAGQSRWGEAISSYRTAIRHAANADRVAREYLGNSLKSAAVRLATSPDDKVRDPAVAVEFAREAAVFDPRWNVLGVAHYHAGDYAAAVSAFQQSIKLRDGGDRTDWYYLALAYWHLNRKDEARKWYDKAAAAVSEKQPPDAEQARLRAEAEKLLGVAAAGGVEVAPPPRVRP
ncbi:MAG TPA: tetratricopeptide repeat protein, partial [Fimbriiglobus sp.]|nr:tetratricopeptide repeat protein [Fimbriiglobus sp.]